MRNIIILVFISPLLTNCLTDNVTTIDQVKSYLYKYGYLQVKDNTSLELINETSISNALLIFQEYYKLPADGKLNNETRDLMLKPRCGNEDNISDFRLTAFKWNKPLVTWHYYLANQEVLELTSKAFAVWEQKSGIRFKHDRTNTDILISNKRLKHMMQTQLTQCTREFDGKLGSLAHAFFPDYINSRREIHVDEDEIWSYSTDKIQSFGYTNLFSTLIHEIGHAIGLSHSDVPDSVMFAYYNSEIDLSDDDVLAIQNLYGKPQQNTLPVSTTPISPTKEDNNVVANKIDLCYLKNLNTFLIADKRLYILYEKWLWIVNIDDMIYSEPIIITDWLTFLPNNFSRVLAVYQRPSGEIVMFVDSLVYMFDLVSLRLTHGYPKHLLSVFNIQPNKLHTVFNSYTGKTFIFHNDNYFREVDECSFTIRSWGYISQRFPGVPPNIDSSFRFVDGNIYFFKNNTIFVFNEFTGKLLKTERNTLSVFGLECVNDNVLYQLKDLIQRLIIQKQK